MTSTLQILRGAFPVSILMGLLAIPTISVAAEQPLVDGMAVYSTYCSRCHLDPSKLRLPRERLQQFLTPGVVPQHRFTLSVAEREALLAWLGSD
jgi:mono/diheme cytochrome c family protein